jgi:hypothetical protein
MAQGTNPLFTVDAKAMTILRPIDTAISALGTNWTYLASWNLAKTNLLWTSEGKQFLVSGFQYAHNVHKTGPLATNLHYGAEACIISVGAPKRMTWSGLAGKTTIAGHVTDRDILVSCQTWNPENPDLEEQIRRTVERVVADLKKTMETNSPNHTSEGIRQPADGSPKPSM